MLRVSTLDALAGLVVDLAAGAEGAGDLARAKLLGPLDQRGDGRTRGVALADHGDRLVELRVDDLLGRRDGLAALVEPLRRPAARARRCRSG